MANVASIDDRAISRVVPGTSSRRSNSTIFQSTANSGFDKSRRIAQWNTGGRPMSSKRRFRAVEIRLRAGMSAPESTVDVEQFVTNLFEFQYREVTMVGATLTVLVASIVFFPGFENVGQGVQSELSVGLLAVLSLVAIVAGIVKGMTGFGYSLIMTPIFATVVDPTVAVVVLAIPRGCSICSRSRKPERGGRSFAKSGRSCCSPLSGPSSASQRWRRTAPDRSSPSLSVSFSSATSSFRSCRTS